MRPWKAHWDRQLYKALEHQYQMGLEALNENLPEIKVELTYRFVKWQGSNGLKAILRPFYVIFHKMASDKREFSLEKFTSI
jgi:dynein heavy chain 2